jgi:hypothetical protein
MTENRQKRLRVQIDEDVYSKIRKYARQDDRKPSEVYGEALERGINQILEDQEE